MEMLNSPIGLFVIACIFVLVGACAYHFVETEKRKKALKHKIQLICLSILQQKNQLNAKVELSECFGKKIKLLLSDEENEYATCELVEDFLKVFTREDLEKGEGWPMVQVLVGSMRSLFSTTGAIDIIANNNLLEGIFKRGEAIGGSYSLGILREYVLKEIILHPDFDFGIQSTKIYVCLSPEQQTSERRAEYLMESDKLLRSFEPFILSVGHTLVIEKHKDLCEKFSKWKSDFINATPQELEIIKHENLKNLLKNNS